MNLEEKKERLKKYITKTINFQIDHADSLDYLEIRIRNHEGNIQVESTNKNREKAY